MTNATTNTTTVILKRNGKVSNRITAEFDFTNPDLSAFYLTDDLYNTEFKEIKCQVENVLAAFENWAKEQALLVGLPNWVAKNINSAMPMYTTSMTKNTCKNFIKKFKTEEWYRRDWNEETRESFFQPELTADQIETLTGIISKGFEQFAALNADWKANKSNLKSGSRKADEAKAAREADKIARGYTSDPVVRGELDRLAAPAKVALAERFIAHRANELDNLLELFKKYNVTEEDLTNYCTLAYSYIEQRSAGREDRAEEKRMEKVNASMREALFATHNYDRDNQTFSLKTAEQNQAEAVRYADDVWETFLGKMEFKVCGLGITSIESTNFGSSEGWTSTMNCTARNGITFTLTNSIVLKCSYLGTWFNQFPARFGDVCRNGQAVKNAADEASVRSLCSE